MSNLDKLREANFHQVVDLVKTHKTAHVTSVMVTETRLNQLKSMFICAAVPYTGNGKCFMLCR